MRLVDLTHSIVTKTVHKIITVVVGPGVVGMQVQGVVGSRGGGVPVGGWVRAGMVGTQGWVDMG